jgi:hypothetical protein
VRNVQVFEDLLGHALEHWGGDLSTLMRADSGV